MFCYNGSFNYANEFINTISIVDLNIRVGRRLLCVCVSCMRIIGIALFYDWINFSQITKTMQGYILFQFKPFFIINYFSPCFCWGFIVLFSYGGVQLTRVLCSLSSSGRFTQPFKQFIKHEVNRSKKWQGSG